LNTLIASFFSLSVFELTRVVYKQHAVLLKHFCVAFYNTLKHIFWKKKENKAVLFYQKIK